MTRRTENVLCDLIEYANVIGFKPTEDEKEIMSGDGTDAEIVQLALKVFGKNVPKYIKEMAKKLGV